MSEQDDLTLSVSPETYYRISVTTPDSDERLVLTNAGQGQWWDNEGNDWRTSDIVERDVAWKPVTRVWVESGGKPDPRKFPPGSTVRIKWGPVYWDSLDGTYNPCHASVEVGRHYVVASEEGENLFLESGTPHMHYLITFNSVELVSN